MTLPRHAEAEPKDDSLKSSASFGTSLVRSLRPLAYMVTVIQPSRRAFPMRPSVLHQCANSACPGLFRSLHDGKLFLRETDGAGPASGIPVPNRGGRLRRRTERYWLCDECAPLLTLAFERGRGMVTVPLPARNTSPPIAHLTQMHFTLKGYRAG
jgi:hypothetical protein